MIMIFFNQMKRKILFTVVFSAFLLTLVSSCGIWDPADARKVSPNADDWRSATTVVSDTFTPSTQAEMTVPMGTCIPPKNPLPVNK